MLRKWERSGWDWGGTKGWRRKRCSEVQGRHDVRERWFLGNGVIAESALASPWTNACAYRHLFCGLTSLSIQGGWLWPSLSL